MKRFLPLLIIMLLAAVVFAQEATPEVTPEFTPEATAEITQNTCPTLVREAQDFAASNCSELDTNQACIAYDAVTGETNIPNTLNNVGDRVGVWDIRSVQMSSMDLVNGLWGLLLMSVEVDVSGDGAFQDSIQIVLYGDAELQNTSRFVQVIALTDIDIYEKPRTDSPILSQLAQDDNIIVNSQLEDGLWLRVRFNSEETGESQLGWLQTDLVEATSPLDEVTILTPEEAEEIPDETSQFGSMQAFYFESGQDDALCEEAPNSGMLIQTPEGEASVSFVIDEVVVTMNGTGVITAEADGNFTVIVVEGEADVCHDNVCSTAGANEAIDVVLDSDLNAIGTPSEAREATASELQGLPLNVVDDPVATPNNTPLAGSWIFILDTPLPLTCADGSTVEYISLSTAATIEPQIDSLIVSGVSYNEVGSGIYSTSYSDPDGNISRDSLRVISPERIVGDRTIDMVNSTCSLSLNFHYELVEAK